MITIDLITGFLGSGKTTFIKKYARYLIDQGLKIGILENDFGAVNVDMLLLQELLGEQCDLEMVSGGCDKDCHIRRFKTKLIAMGMSGYDRVIVEPSGIFDVDEFFDSLREDPLDQWYEIGNVITIVDALLNPQLSEESDYLLASEVADAGKIIISHVDEASSEQIDGTVQHLNEALRKIKCKRQLTKEDVIAENMEQLSEKALDAVSHCGYKTESYCKLDTGDYKGFDSVYFMNAEISEEKLKEAAGKILSVPACGNVFRMKGFIRKGSGWLQLNATRSVIELKPIGTGQEVLIVIGENLNAEVISDILGAKPAV